MPKTTSQDGGSALSSRELVAKLLVHDGLAEDNSSAKTRAGDMTAKQLKDYRLR
jgi:hypothetical protein